MKTKEEYLDILRKYSDLKSKVYGIVKIGIFGSVARNEQTEDSDVDVCVEMQKPDMFSLVHIKEDLQQLFGRSVDLVRLRDNMNPMLSKQIQRDGIYDEELLYYSLQRIATAIERIINNSKFIDNSEYYLLSPAGMERLESTCMLLLAVGEGIKGIDKMTNKQLLPNYPEVDWKGAMGIRDIIAHHYFDIDEAIVFEVVKNKLPGMLKTINKMLEEI